MNLAAELAARRAASTEIARPTLFDLARVEDERALALLFSDAALAVVDTMELQLADLVAVRRRSDQLGAEVVAAEVSRILDGTAAFQYGRWVHYPWARTLVHVLPEAELIEVRCDRNRHKITAAEQALLGKKRIGVVGLSVGAAVAAALAQERIGGLFRLADFDTLSLSNLNRLAARVADIGDNKAVLASRRIAELDPYLAVEILPRGIGDDNLDAFLTEGGKLDLLIEECDDLYQKVRLREAARRHGIAVVMHTSEGGILDVERFDREPGRPIFHGLLGDLEAAALRSLPTRDKAPFVLALLGDTFSARFRASLVEIGETLSAWPQLGSSVALGGGVVADVARRILLGSFTASGRFSVDPSEQVSDERARPPAIERSAAAPVPESTRPRVLPRIDAGAAIGPAEARFLVEHAVLAPSGGNAQPWRFCFRDGRLECFVDRARARTFLDVDRRASLVALGAAIENIALAARHIGFAATPRLFPDAGDAARVASLSFARAPEAPSPLYDAIGGRVTNRKRAPSPRALAGATVAALTAAAGSHGAAVQFLAGDALEELATLVGRADRLRLLSARMHGELYSELRLSARATVETRDGIDLATLELDAAASAVITVLADAAVPELLAAVGGGRGLLRPARDRVVGSSAVCLLTVNGDDGAAFVAGGRALERLWLTATSLGVAAQPEAPLLYLLTRRRVAPATLSDAERGELEDLERGFSRHFGDTRGRALVMLLRLSTGVARWTARSLRRPVDDVFTID